MVTKTFEAIYDGKVLRPLNPLELEPNTSVRVRIEVPNVKGIKKKKKSFLDVIEGLKVEAPPDWSENIEDYLQAEKYGFDL